MKKTIAICGVTVAALAALASCDTPATVASRNLSKAADNFEINRRVVFYNGITDSYMLTVEGRCAVEVSTKFTVTCRTGPDAFKKHYLWLSDNVSFFAEQLEPADVSTFHYRVMFRPQSIIPDVDFQGDLDELRPND